MGREATRAVSRGRPSVAEALRAHASVICLQHPSLPPHSTTEQVSLKKKKKGCPPPPPLYQGGNQTLKRPANRSAFFKPSLNIWNIWKFSVPVLLKHFSRFPGLSPQLRHVLPECPLPVPQRARCNNHTALFICFTSLRNHCILLPVAQ